MAPVSRALALAAHLVLFALCAVGCSAVRPEKPGAATAPPVVETGAADAAAAPVKACRRTGCSSEICSDQDLASTCVYRSEYACYERAKCERQANGECGWTETPELTRCLADAKARQ